jgi:tetratricopeptide (TPR) repeat protein
MVALCSGAAPALAGASTDERVQPVDDSPPMSAADAHDLLMAGSYEDAIEAFEALAREPRDRAEAAIGLARCRMHLGQYDEAISGLTASPAADSPDGHYLLAKLLLLKGQYVKALEHAQHAIDLHKSHARARLLKAETLELLGKRDEAIETYRWFDRQVTQREELPGDAEWITAAALGFMRYSILTQTNIARRTQHVLHEMLQMAYERVDRTYWPARIAAADLLREKFNNDEEDGSVADYNAALRINENLCEAHVGLGEIALENWDFEEAERRADLALKVNPNHAPAIHLRAKTLLRERRYGQAAAMCELVLVVNPNDLTALSLSAAAGACQYDTAHVESMRARVKKINPANAAIHRALGDALSGMRQYTAAEREYLDAIKLSPTDANPRTELGMMYMQWGLEDKARDALDAAWVLDPFNQRTKFTLELLESLQKFARVETDHFIVSYDPTRDPALGEQIAAYLEEIYPLVTGDFATTLEHKTIIEVFPTQRAFAVRITGNPWIHTIGACTGRVIAMASPRRSAKLTGAFNYARVLIHEFTHTVTLAGTHNRISHWFTEGLAVAQEDAPRDFYSWELLADAVRRDELFTLESIDWAFIRPRRAADRPTAYAQSEWMCEYIVQRFGYDTINALLARFRGGQTQKEALTAQLGLEPEAFDRDFREWARTETARWGFDLTPPEDVEALRELAKAQSDDASVLGRLARAEFDAGQYKRALTAGRRAVKLDQNQPAGLEVLARIHGMNIRGAQTKLTRRGYEDEALPTLERLLRVDRDGWTAPKLLGEIALRRKDWDRAAELFARLQRLCPLDPASWKGLAGVYLARGDHDLALPQLLEVARTQADDADVPAQIADICSRQGRLHDARFWYRRAIQIDPFNVEIRGALGAICMRAGWTEAALQEYLVLTQLEPADAEHFENAATAAHKLGDRKQAEKLARQALELDPASPARSLLP